MARNAWDLVVGIRERCGVFASFLIIFFVDIHFSTNRDGFQSFPLSSQMVRLTNVRRSDKEMREMRVGRRRCRVRREAERILGCRQQRASWVPCPFLVGRTGKKKAV